MMQQASHSLPSRSNGGNPSDRFSGAAAVQNEFGAEPQRRMRLARRGGVLAALALLAAGAQAQLTFPKQQKVGSTSSAVAVTVTSQAAGAVNTVEVLTQGESGLDFAVAGSGSNCATKTFTAVGQNCTESVAFTPAYPGLRVGAVVLLDSGNNVLGTAYVSGVGQGGLAVLAPGSLLEVAGILREAGGAVNGGLAVNEDLDEPSGVALDGAGNVYIADSFNNQVRMVCAGASSATIAGVSCTAAGIIVEIAGDGVPQAGVTFNYPTGVALDGAGNLYIADKRNNVIRKITAASGAISTVAGDGYIDPNTGLGGYSGDGGPATQAELNYPQGVSVDVNGNLFIADTDNQRIRMVAAVTANGYTAGDIYTVAGNGTQGFGGDSAAATGAKLDQPFPVAFDSSGNMYIPDSGNNRIREVAAVSGAITAASVITTAAGTGGGVDQCANGPASGAGLSAPSGVAVDAAGNLYISDSGNLCVRKTNAVSGQIVQIAVQGDFYVAANGIPGGESIYVPQGIVLDGAGNVYFADHYDMLVDEIRSNKAALNFTGTPVRQGNQSAPLSQTVENDGNAPLDLTALTPDANALVDASNPPTTCAALPYPMTADADCTVGAIFSPSVSGNPVFGNIDVTNNTSINNPLDIVLVGNASAINSTTIGVSPNINPAQFTSTVIFTATVQTGAGTGNLTGAVDFYDGGTLLGSVAVGASTTIGSTTTAQAQYSTKTLAVGAHSITVKYDNTLDPAHSASTSAPPLIEVIYEATRTELAAQPGSPSLLGASVVLTATVTVPDGGTQPLDGSVTFTDRSATFNNNTVPLTGGVASYTTNVLVQGVNAITATYTPVVTTPALIQGSADTLFQDVVTASTTTLSSAPNPSTYGTPATFTVTVPTSGPAEATGKVNIVIVPQGQTTPTYPLTATLSGNPGTGTAAISTLPVGTYTATASYDGDTNYGASTATLAPPQVVSQVQTTTKLAAVPNPGIAGQPIAITATVTPNSGTATPTGTVTFTDSLNGGAPVTLGAPTLSGTGTATVNPASLAPGAHSIVATYSGDADDAGSTATLSLPVNLVTTTTTVSATPSPAVVGATITFTATVVTMPAGGTPTGTVTFSAAGPNGNVALGSPNLAAGVATVTSATLPAGSYTITAAYSGDANDAKSSATTSETVELTPTTTDLTSATVNGAEVLVAVVQNNAVSASTPTGTVTFTSGTTVIGKATLDADGVTTLTPSLAVGTYTVVASYGGDAGHSSSKSGPVSITIAGAASSFTLTVTPASVTVAATQNTTVKVTLTSISGFADTIGLGCASLPAGVNCEFSSISVPLAANGKGTSQLTIDTNNPLGGGASAMNRQPGNRMTSLAGLFLPFSLLLGCVVWRFRRRHSRLLSMVMLLVLGGAALLAAGCTGFSQNYAAPGTYTIQVVGVGQTSNVTQYQNVTLNITAK